MKTEGRRRPVATVLVLVVLATLRTPPCAAQSNDICRYQYTEQPLRNLQCDPYRSGRLIIDCTVMYGPEEVQVNLEWVFRSFQGVASGFISNSGNKYTITSRNSQSTALSQLRVDSLSDSDAGNYFCQIRFRNDTLTEPSQSLELFSSDVFRAQDFSPCSQTEPQSSEVQLCALIGDIGNGVPLPGVPGGGGGDSNGGDSGGGDSGGGDSGGGGGSFGSSGTSNAVLFSIIGGVALFIVLAILLIISVVCVHQFCSRPYSY